MGMIIIKRIINYFILFLVLFIIGCGGKKNTGVVGQPYTFTVDSADLTSDTEIQWSILDQPLSSILVQDELVFSDNNHEMTFFPEYTGTYSFQVIMLQYGDTISVREFDVEITGTDRVPVRQSDQYVADESWLEESADEGDEVAELPAMTDHEERKPVEAPALEMIPAAEPPAVVEKPVIKKVKPQPPAPLPGSTIPIIKGKYTIQVSSWPDLEGAEKEYARLAQQGFDAYIQRAYFKENDKIWYRVRVGSYDNYDQAARVSKSISSTLNVVAWVDFVRKDQ